MFVSKFVLFYKDILFYVALQYHSEYIEMVKPTKRQFTELY